MYGDPYPDQPLVERIRASDDEAFVLSHLHHENIFVRVAVADWYAVGRRANDGVDANVAMPQAEGRPLMPDSVAAVLLADDDMVARAAAGRTNDVQALLAAALDPVGLIVDEAIARLVHLDQVDVLLVGGMPKVSTIALPLASHADDPTLLASLWADQQVDANLRSVLLENRALPRGLWAEALRAPTPARPAGGDATWFTSLTQAASWFEGGSELGDVEDAEDREDRRAVYRRFATLCRTAALTLLDACERPEWVEASISWALEIAAVAGHPDRAYARMGIRRGAPATQGLQAPRTAIFAASHALWDRGERDTEYRDLAGAGSRLLEVFADGGFSRLRRHHRGGLDEFDVSVAVALDAVRPLLLLTLDDDSELHPRPQ